MSQPSNEACSSFNTPLFSSSQDTRFDQEQPNTHYAFLVHSKDTFNLPPSVDNKALARQRRKRTSPDDQAILEAEFLRDPKPDRTKRLDIVQRVALGDKEVQIWFQNRRQSKRRRSLPPLSDNAIPRPEPVATADETSDASSPQWAAPSQKHVFKVVTSASSEPQSSYTQSSTTISSREDGSPHDLSRGNGSVSQTPSPSSSATTSSQPDTSRTEEESMISTQSAPHRLTPQARSVTRPVAIPTIHEESSSTLRLSMTSDGGARIISGKESTPSPPRSQPLAPTPFATRQTLRRSYSNASARDFHHDCPRNFSRLLERKPSGRSRDSRAWEFWCDPEARNELIVKAHKDTTGSAVDAIKLIRSNSASRRYKTPTPIGRRADATSICENQGVSGHRTSNSESDKENRSPPDSQKADGAKEAHPSRPVDHSRRAVLGEARIGLGIHGSVRPGRQDLQQKSRPGDRDASEKGASDDNDDEVEGFMTGNTSANSYKETKSFVERTTDEHDDEMDCIAGLLSLSQGNWR